MAPFTCAPGANTSQFEACYPKPSLLGGLVFDDCGRHRSDPWAFGCECAGLFSDCARLFGCVANETAAALCVAETCKPMQCGSDLIPPSTSTLSFASSGITTSTPFSVSVETSAASSSTPISGSTPGTGGTLVVTPSPMSLISTTTTATTLSLGSSASASDDLPVGLWIGLGVAAAACLIGFLIAAFVWRQRRRRDRRASNDAAEGAVPLNSGTAAPGTQRAQSTVPPENSLYVPGSLSPSQVPNFTTNVSAVGTRAADSTQARSTKRHRHRRRNSNSGSGSGDTKGHSDDDDDDDDHANDAGDSRISGYEAVPSLSASGRNKKRLSDGYDAVPPTVSSKSNGGSTNRSNSKRKHQQQQNGNHSEDRLSSVMPQSSANGYDLIPSGANGTRSAAAESGYDKLPGANRASGHTYELVPEVHTTSSIGLKRGK